MRITVTALTEKGRRGLLEDLKERKKAPLHERLLFNQLFNMVVSWDINKEPVSLVLSSRTSFTDRVDATFYGEQFRKGFGTLGCIEGVDYTYKLEKEASKK